MGREAVDRNRLAVGHLLHHPRRRCCSGGIRLAICPNWLRPLLLRDCGGKRVLWEEIVLPLGSLVLHLLLRGLVFRLRVLDDGAELVAGGLEPPVGVGNGYFVKPTVFIVNDPKAAIAQEEIFGPY